MVHGIISLIAMPVVTNILKEVKISSFNTSIANLTKVLEEQCSQELMDGKTLSTRYIFTNGESNPFIEASGNIPNSGYALVNNKCEVTYYNASDGDYYINGDNDNLEVTDNVKHSNYYNYGTDIYFSMTLNTSDITEENAYDKHLEVGDSIFVITDEQRKINYYSFAFYSHSIDEDKSKNIVEILNKRIKGTDLENIFVNGFEYYIDYENNMTYYTSDTCPYFNASKANICRNDIYDLMEKEFVEREMSHIKVK